MAAGFGGALGGWSALYSGGLVSGAFGGAAYSWAKQYLNNGSVDYGTLAAETTVSSLTAGVFSRALPAATKQLFSNNVKGDIGEGLSKVYNWMKGSELIDTQVTNVAGLRTVIDSQWWSFQRRDLLR